MNYLYSIENCIANSIPHIYSWMKIICTVLNTIENGKMKLKNIKVKKEIKHSSSAIELTSKQGDFKPPNVGPLSTFAETWTEALVSHQAFVTMFHQARCQI